MDKREILLKHLRELFAEHALDGSRLKVWRGIDGAWYYAPFGEDFGKLGDTFEDALTNIDVTLLAQRRFAQLPTIN